MPGITLLMQISQKCNQLILYLVVVDKLSGKNVYVRFFYQSFFLVVCSNRSLIKLKIKMPIVSSLCS